MAEKKPDTVGKKVQDRRGQTLAEYAFIISLIALACVAGVTLLGDSIGSFFTGFNGSF